MKKVVLKEGREKSVLKRHPWIFSGAIAQLPSIEPGEVCALHAASGEFLATAYFHPDNSLSGRILSFMNEEIAITLENRIKQAIAFRATLFDASTTGMRLINAEGDGIPGLIVDRYDTTLVIQINTWGIERLRTPIIDLLIKYAEPTSIYEKSTSSSRREEGLSDREGFLFGPAIEQVEIVENGIPFTVPIVGGQKTGFFLDHRAMRKKIGELSQNKRVLNLFAYTGGFSQYALRGGAAHVTSVDISQKACDLNRQASNHTIICDDVFNFLKTAESKYDLIIVDPPAFAKKRGDIDRACAAYKELNAQAMRLLAPGGILLTSSCSYFIDDTLFQNLIFQASLLADRTAQIIGRHVVAPDHPTLITHPEGTYLCSLLLHL
jgi:23S rRNA (cytosine1962-C5)-methyltransferase